MKFCLIILLVLNITCKAGGALCWANVNDEFLVAATNCDFETLQKCLDNGANINAQDHGGNTALHLVCRKNNLKCANYLLFIGADPDITNSNLDTALSWAVYLRQYEILELLLNIGANANTVNSSGYCPIGWAVYKNDLESVRLLVRGNVNLGVQTVTGDTLSAVIKELKKNAEFKELATILEGNPKNKIYPLLYLAQNGQVAQMRNLLNKQEKPALKDFINVRGPKGITPLMAACQNGHKLAAKLLLGLGADPNIKNSKGQTALMLTAKKGYTNTGAMLLKHKADPNIQDNYGITALMWACAFGHSDTVEMLIARKSNITLVNLYAETAADIALTAGYPIIAQNLKSINKKGF